MKRDSFAEFQLMQHSEEEDELTAMAEKEPLFIIFSLS